MLKALRVLYASDVTIEIFNERLSKLGGIPRLLFEDARSPDDIIEAGFGRSSLESCTRVIGEIYDARDVSHIISTCAQPLTLKVIACPMLLTSLPIKCFRNLSI